VIPWPKKPFLSLCCSPTPPPPLPPPPPPPLSPPATITQPLRDFNPQIVSLSKLACLDLLPTTPTFRHLTYLIDHHHTPPPAKRHSLFCKLPQPHISFPSPYFVFLPCYIRSSLACRTPVNTKKSSRLDGGYPDLDRSTALQTLTARTCLSLPQRRHPPLSTPTPRNPGISQIHLHQHGGVRSCSDFRYYFRDYQPVLSPLWHFRFTRSCFTTDTQTCSRLAWVPSASFGKLARWDECAPYLTASHW
jgi:hypothetical protein